MAEITDISQGLFYIPTNKYQTAIAPIRNPIDSDTGCSLVIIWQS